MTEIQVERLTIRIGAHSSRSIYIYGMFAILVLFSATFYLWMTAHHKIDYFSNYQSFNVIGCKAFEISDSGRTVDFTVTVGNVYPQEETVVGKLPMKNDEHIVLSGNEVMWHGTYDVKENKLPTALIYFQKGKHLDDFSERRFYNVSCIRFHNTLREMSLNWTQNEAEAVELLQLETNGTAFPKQQTKELVCYDFKIHPLIGTDRLDVAVFLTNPYDKEEVVVSNYPKNGRETIVMTDNDIVWYGSFKLSYHEKFMDSILSFENKNGSVRHLYDFKCNSLNTALDQFLEEWWSTRYCVDCVYITTLLFIFLMFGGVVGLMGGEWAARRALKKIVILSAPRKTILIP